MATTNTDTNKDNGKTSTPPQTNTTPDVAQHKLSIETCVKALGETLISGRKALATELAVCLAMFAGAKSTAGEARDVVTGLYLKAGYDCLNKESRHFKTVQRRIGASVGLYNKLGYEVIAGWIGEAQEAKMLSAIEAGLSNYKFEVMDDVLEFAGRASNRTAKKSGAKAGKGKTAKPAKTELPEVPMFKFKVHKIKVEIPQSTPAADLIALAAKILAEGRRKEQMELKASVAQPSSAPEIQQPVLH